MYHYVRPIKNSRFSGIKGLELDLFKEQVNYLNKNYNIITMEEAVHSIHNGGKLPTKAALLTFDDAYLDHFLHAYPILKKNNIQGSFFAPVKAVTENELLDVNKIHFILASLNGDLQLLLNRIKQLITKNTEKYNLNTYQFYYDKLAVKNRFDPAEVIFFKRLLQSELPEAARVEFTSILFEEYLGQSEESFAKELYMNQSHIEHMISDGMHFGSHGLNHYWWDKLNSIKLEEEINKSTDFLITCGSNPNFLTACYPYGAFNELSIETLKKYNYKVALTTDVRIADIKTDNPFKLPRLDTNDISSKEKNK
jgi:peptidoglycan/xylan/chitin deacetylase (PgdA/CDA1 family)